MKYLSKLSKREITSIILCAVLFGFVFVISIYLPPIPMPVVFLMVVTSCIYGMVAGNQSSRNENNQKEIE